MLLYLFAPRKNDLILQVGLVPGYINLTMFSTMVNFYDGTVRTAVRNVGKGLCYNVGRGIGAVLRAMGDFLAGKLGLAAAIAIFTFSGLALMIAGLLLLQETKSDHWKAWNAPAGGTASGPWYIGCTRETVLTVGFRWGTILLISRRMPE